MSAKYIPAWNFQLVFSLLALQIVNSWVNKKGQLTCCNTELQFCSSMGTHTLYYGSILRGRGIHCQGRSQIWRSIAIRNCDCKSKLKVSNNPFSDSVFLEESSTWNTWCNNPLNSISTKCSAGIGNHLPRTGSLGPIQTGGQGDVGCKKAYCANKVNSELLQSSVCW